MSTIQKKIDLIILAGGKGSRISKHLKNIPKPLFRFDNKAFLQILVNHFSKYPFNKAYILAGHRGRQIYNQFNNKNFNFLNFKCIIEKKSLGTAGCIAQLKNKITNDFVVINGDSILLEDINFIFKKKQNQNLIFLTKNKNYKSNKKLSNLNLDRKGKITPSLKGKLMNAGIYYFKKSLLDKIPLKKTSLENEIILKLIMSKKIIGHESNNFFSDIGTDENLKFAKKKLPNVLKKKACFLDRDGVINYDYGYVNNFKNFKFKQGVLNGLKLLVKKNYYIFIVTNQAGIAKKKFTFDDFCYLHKKLKNFLAIKNINFDDIQFSPFHKDSKIKKYKKNSNFRKPGNLMIKKIFKNFFIDKKKSFSIGDQVTDKHAFNKSNLYFEYAEKNFYKQIKRLTNDH